jgi:chromatin remodeling complex protein RSC6
MFSVLWAGVVPKVVEHLPRKHKALSSNSSTTKKKKKERKKEGGREGKERKGKEEGKEGRKEKEREFTSWDCGTCLSLWPWDDPHTPTQKKKKNSLVTLGSCL